MLQSSQLRAARALLGWRQEDLAQAAGVGLATLARMEQGAGVVQGNFSTVMKLQSTLQLQGVCFLNGQEGYGVQLLKALAANAPTPAAPTGTSRRRKKQNKPPRRGSGA